MPSDAVTQLLTAPAPAQPLIHARSGNVALLETDKVISMDRLLAPRVGLAGVRLDPVTGITDIEPMVRQITVVHANAHADEHTTGSSHAQPATWTAEGDSRFTFVQFSPDGDKLSALQVKTGKPSELWIYDLATRRARKLSSHVSPVWGNPCEWADASSLLCRMRPKRLPALPAPASDGPVAVAHPGGALPTRTYTMLLENGYDDARFEHYFTVELARISTKGKVERYGVAPGLIRQFEVAPGGQYVLLRRLQPPYPRLVTAPRFPATVEVWELAAGKRIYQSEPVGFGLDDSDEYGAELDSIQWQPDRPATAGYLYRQPLRDGAVEYQWRTLEASLASPAVVLARSPTRILSFGWSSAGTPWHLSRGAAGDTVLTALLPEGDKTLWRGDRTDPDANPGRVLRVDGQQGPVLEHNGHIFLAGDGLSDDGPRPFLNSVDIHSGETRQLWLAARGVYEPVLAILDPEKAVWLTRRETETRPPQLNRVQQGTVTTLHSSVDPYPALQRVERRLIQYPRADGVTLRATLYLPENNDTPKPLPTLIWIYPREYDDPEQAQQLDSKAFRFHNIVGPSAIAATLAGYAVVVSPTVPILSTEDGNGYLPQLVSSTDALVDFLVDNNISHPARIAIGGRSYGAFSAANLLIHSDKFASGIAMSGAYNRTLTPFGFQHEKRNFWEATDYYSSISPFFHANKVKKPLLLVHGGEDPNPGTPKAQARRFFHALVGEGAVCRYVELPGEAHHYRGRETVLYATWEMINWLDITIGPKAGLAD
ncbi:S9 family peptidase [Pseudomaricurvus sp. HS19]|uniref:alpha/beta hydrolase family protein n=1 Tax=Pseudomaricurvus sp. HS19 TaxID=2692626 RepID=UPI00136E227B|nr:prolyl oligopeptidase family serine peptidase [Pseudomaricurvus sp. HS19]MYM64077.1 prolyl oligopeptidase family serine peptidase [Pseudomaricurvus sp. HS19]